MHLINAFTGPSLLDYVEGALKTNQGDRFDVGVGFATNLTGTTFERFGNALDEWLAGDKTRKFRLFIGDHRHRRDSPAQRRDKVDAATAVAARLIAHTRSIEEQTEIIYLSRLHAKFYCMWSIAQQAEELAWAIVGSSNLTDAALEEKNFELDLYLPAQHSQLGDLQAPLAAFIEEVYNAGKQESDLHKTIEDRTAGSRWENAKARQGEKWEAESAAEADAEDLVDLDEQARLESDRNLGIAGS